MPPKAILIARMIYCTSSYSPTLPSIALIYYYCERDHDDVLDCAIVEGIIVDQKW